MTILDALSDPNLFTRQFAGESWASWRAFLAALFGLTLDGDALVLYRECTGRETPPAGPARECWVVVGRRGGKSRVAALVAVFLACFRDYSGVLAAGEVGTVMVLAADRKQARTVLRYIRGLLNSSPLLARIVAHETRESIDLKNRVTIEVHTSSYRAVRGYTIVAAVLDEIAFWPDPESANPDVETVNALRPAMATVPGALLLGTSTPYARRGALWSAFEKHHGQDGDPVLVWRAPTRTMNPTVGEALIAAAFEEDPAAAAAEWGAEFRADIESFLAPDALAVVTVPGRRELPRAEGARHVAFCDPSGGSGQDSMAMGVAHVESRVAVLDALREARPPFSPDEVVREFAGVLKSYGITRVVGDRYAGEWPRERFREHGIEYTPAEKTKSELYAEFLPLVNAGRVELLDDARLRAQLLGLERRTGRSGRDSIDHGPGRHDDAANATAAALVLAVAASSSRAVTSADIAGFTAANAGVSGIHGFRSATGEWIDRVTPGFSDYG